MQRGELADLLCSGPLLFDGGMGTSLVDLGVPVGACFELLNVEDPGLVEKVHQGFVEAGSRVVITNTFGGNRFALGRRGLADRVAELNRAAVEVARRTGALVAGSVGPLRVRLAPYGRVRPAEAFDAYAEQARALAEAGADVLAVETSSDLREMEQSLMAALETTDLPVMVTATFARDDQTLMGQSPEQVVTRLIELGADVVGVNCGQGPAQALRLIRTMRPLVGQTPLAWRPNAGGPRQVAGRFLYPATPDYFAEHAAAMLEDGVAVVGGCCGTRPEHVRAMAAVLGQHGGSRVEVITAERLETVGEGSPSPTELGRKLAGGRFVIAVELDPPRGHATAGMLAAAETLVEAGADVVNIADSPMARLRMSPWAACRLIQEQAGVETVLHFPTRGRNLLRIQGDLLAVHALGIRNLFVCLGDPVAIGDYPGGTDHVDVAPTGLIDIITAGFNRGRDQSGASIGQPTSFLVGCAVNLDPPDLDRECRLLRRKIDAGASFALSQPAYSAEPLLRLRHRYEDRYGALTLPVLAGVLPLATGRHAEFLHNEVPGVVVPAEIRDRLRRAGDRAEDEGLRIAIQAALELREVAGGIFVMPQLGRFDMAAEVVEAARRA